MVKTIINNFTDRSFFFESAISCLNYGVELDFAKKIQRFFCQKHKVRLRYQLLSLHLRLFQYLHAFEINSRVRLTEYEIIDIMNRN